MLEKQVSEEIDMDPNEEEVIIMEDMREDHWRDVSEDDDDKKKIHALIWYFYTKEKVELINREFLVSVTHPKGGNIVWTCVKDHIFRENDHYISIGLRGYDYILFKYGEGKGVRYGLDSYTYLKNFIQLWPGDWLKQM